jgi:hypothetical protein
MSLRNRLIVLSVVALLVAPTWGDRAAAAFVISVLAVAVWRLAPEALR